MTCFLQQRKLFINVLQQQFSCIFTSRIEIVSWPIYHIKIMHSVNVLLCSLLFRKGQFTHTHDDVIKWKHFPRYWPFVRGIHRSPVNSLHKGQWRRALMFTLICVWIDGRVNNHKAGYLKRYRAHYDVIVMSTGIGLLLAGTGATIRLPRWSNNE